jgi:hypothetical protein
MKRILTLALLAAFVLGCGATAGAVELKVSGQFQVHGEWLDNVGNNQIWGPGTSGDNFLSRPQSDAWHRTLGTGPGGKADPFAVEQRLRANFNFIANEDLKVVWSIEVGTSFWGQSLSSNGVNNNLGRSSGFGPDGDGVNIETRWAYLDFNVPGTKVGVKVGLQPIITPSAFNGYSAIYDMDAPAAVVSVPVNDMVGVTVGWFRDRDQFSGSTGWDPAGTRAYDEADFFFAYLPITPKGINFTPFFVYGLDGRDAGDAGANGYFGLNMPTGAGTTLNTFPVANPLHAVASDSTKIWWAGAALEVKLLDPLVISADFNYGNETNGGADLGRKGWLADAMVQYKGLAIGTPTVFGMYSSGENNDGSDRRSERMPFLQSFWAPAGSFYYTGTSFDSWQADIGGNSQNTEGTWNVGAGLYGMSFLDKLTHDLIVMYIGGTNSVSSIPLLNATQNAVGFGNALTDKDHLIEVDFNHQYQIYEQLTAIVELGFIKPHFDKAAWGLDGTSNAWRAQFGFKYKF